MRLYVNAVVFFVLSVFRPSDGNESPLEMFSWKHFWIVMHIFIERNECNHQNRSLPIGLQVAEIPSLCSMAAFRTATVSRLNQGEPRDKISTL